MNVSLDGVSLDGFFASLRAAIASLPDPMAKHQPHTGDTMTKHELTVKKVADLFDEIHQPPGYLNWDSLRDDEAARELQFARAAYDLGRQASTADSGSAWTDDELRAAIDEAASVGGSISIDHVFEGSTETVANYVVQDTRLLLTALGIDHQPKPELPDTPGALIYDAVDDQGHTYRVMQKGMFGWYGADEAGAMGNKDADQITSFGGVLDLDKVRGEQGE